MTSLESTKGGSDPGKTPGGEAPGGPVTKVHRARLVRIYLVRHGRTALNAAGALRGHLDPELDAVGADQVLMLGDVLGRLSLKLVVSSPLRRATETASAVARWAGLEVEKDDRFVDRDYGEWAGHQLDEVVAQYGGVDAAPGVEPASTVLQRARSGLDDVADRIGEGSGVVVSHDAVNRLLLHWIDPSLGEIALIPQDTACFNVIERRDGHWVVVSVNNAPAGHNPSPKLQEASAKSGRTAGG